MRFTLFLCAVVLLIAGCASTGTNVTGGTLPTVHHDRTTLQWGLVGVADVPTLDPALASDPTSITMASLVYGGLVRLDSRLRVQADGASRWTISRDGKTYTFFIRPGLRFADGRRVTAQDFASALRGALGPEGSAGTAPFYLQLIAGAGSPSLRGITVVDPSTLRITLIRPAAHFLSELAFPASFVPDPSLLQRYGATWTDHASGFGPFMVKTWQHSKYVTLVRNPYFYGRQSRIHQISLHFSSLGHALSAYGHGSLDVISGLPAGETLSAHDPGISRVPALALDYLAFNTGRLPFRKINVRRAFTSVIRPGIGAAAMGNTAFRSTGLLPSSFGIASGLWHPSASPALYLARAKYRNVQRFPTVVLATPQDQHLIALAAALKRAWYRSLGIDVEVRHLNASNYTRVLNTRVFDLALVRWGGDYPDPQDFLGTQLGSTPYNVTGWSKPDYAAAVALADSYSPADPRRVQLLERAASIATRALPLVPLDEPALTALVRPDIRGVELTPLGTMAIAPGALHVPG